jgi:hypothetical protein
MFRASWPPEWQQVVDRAEQAELAAELGRETSLGHDLHGLTVRAIARNQGSDDVLFFLPDDRVADVHLTWSHETGTFLPATKIYDDLDSWSRDKAGS